MKTGYYRDDREEYRLTLENGQSVRLFGDALRIGLILPMGSGKSVCYTITRAAGPEEIDYALWELGTTSSKYKRDMDNTIKHDIKRDALMKRIESECEERIAWTIANAERNAELKWVSIAAGACATCYFFGLILGAFMR